MTLTIEQLEDVLEMLRLLHGRHDELVGYKIWAAIDGKTYKYIDSDGFMCALQQLINKVDAEHTRLSVGPFTLAEAVASGRPFRRKGAGYWTRKAPAPGDGEPFFEAMTAFDKWEPCPSVSDQHGFTVAEEWLSIDDITACDYELNLDGGD